MANERIHLQLYRTSGTTQPLAASVEYGELGVGYHNGSEKLFLKNDSNQIVEISSDAQLKTIRDSQDKKISDATGLSSEAGPGGEMSYNYSPESQSLSSFTNMNESVDFIADSLVELTSNVNTIKPEFNVDKNKSNDVYNISYSYQYNGTPLVPKSCTITKYVNEGSGTVILSNVETSSASTTSNIEGCKERYVLDLIPNLSKNIDVRCEETRYLFYVGASSAETISASDVEGFDKYVGDGEKLIAEASTQNGEYIWIVVPSDLEARFVSTSGVQLPLDEETQNITNSLGSFRAYRNERALAEESWQLMILTGTYTPPPVNYLNFTCTSSTGSITFTQGNGVEGTLYYKKGDNDWQEYSSTINLTQGEKVYMKGTFANGMVNFETEGLCQFSMTGIIAAGGNIMTLISGDEPGLVIPSGYCFATLFQGCTSLTTAPELPATTLADGCYYSMFQGCTSLTTAPELPATTLVESCYYGMFQGCTSLTTAPELPAMTLAERCYYYMFRDCTSLTTAPELPATTLVESCYYGMFQGCTSLTTAPELPATTLVESCYYGMFQGCTSLTTAPELPATTLADGCYGEMFYGCTNLNHIKALFTTTPSSLYTGVWVRGVAATGTFVKNASATWNVTGADGVPSGWTVQTASA